MLLLIFMIGLCFPTELYDYQNHTILGYAQGTSYRISYFSGITEPSVRKENIDSLLRAIDGSMSSYHPGSLLLEFNKDETMEIRMDIHLRKVVEKSFEIHRMSAGIFDITVEPLMSLWGFGADPSLSGDPTEDEIREVLAFVGMDKLIMDGFVLKKSHPNVRIDVNGIAQGYTVDVLAEYLESMGIKHYMVELGGEIRARGGKPGGKAFNIGIEGHSRRASQNTYGVLALQNGAVTTSGRIPDGAGKPHHIDPRTGYPFSGGASAVTVFALDAMTADALDNVLITMNKEEVISFIYQLDGVEALLIYQDRNGRFHEWMSAGFGQLLYQTEIH